MNQRYNYAHGLQDQTNKEKSQLSNQLENEKKQKIVLQHQMETMRTQLSAQIQIKEAQIQGNN